MQPARLLLPARLFLFVSALLLSLAGTAQKYYLFIGTYTEGTSKGIYVYRFDAASGKADSVGEVVGVADPSFLTLSPKGDFVYAANELAGRADGEVSAFSFDALSGQLHFLNKQPSGGNSPCYVSVDSSRRWLMVANYGGGNLSAFPIAADGSLGRSAQLIQHTGKGVNPKRQEKPHVHSVVFTPDQRYLLTPDLGLDRIYTYTFSPGDAQPLTPARSPYIETKPGSGPRHIDFSPDHRFMYVIEELAGDVLVYGYSGGKFVPVQTILSNTIDTSADKGGADIHLSPDGKYLYTSNRGNANTLTIYSVHTGSGKLKKIGVVDAGVIMPRNFAIDPDGRFLLVAGQKSNTIAIFKRDTHTGLLTPTGDKIGIGNPVCLKWLPIP
jgi:6-phosphogluconolactonase